MGELGGAGKHGLRKDRGRGGSFHCSCVPWTRWGGWTLGVEGPASGIVADNDLEKRLEYKGKPLFIQLND